MNLYVQLLHIIRAKFESATHFIRGHCITALASLSRRYNVNRSLSYHEMKCYILLIKDKKNQSNSFILVSVEM